MKKQMVRLITIMMVSVGSMADELPEPDAFFKSERGQLLMLQRYCHARGEIMEGKYGSLSQNVQSLLTANGTMNVNYKWENFLYRIETIKIPDSILFYAMMRASNAEPLRVFNQTVEGKQVNSQQYKLVGDALVQYYDNVTTYLRKESPDYRYSTTNIEAIIDLERWDVVADLISYYQDPQRYKNTFKKKHSQFVRIFGLDVEREGRHHNGLRMDDY